MMYHPLQIFVNGLLADRWSRQAAGHRLGARSAGGKEEGTEN
jgi:hypothetical protein